jgi:hypothetical protein
MAKLPARTRVFISYSHKDLKWLERVQIHIKPLVSAGAITCWEDTQIAAGEDWRAVIRTELSAARVAILLISADFLASEFIANEELPSLLRAAEEDGAVILPLIVSPSSFADSRLARFQAINSPDDPLIGMKKPQREDTLVRLAAAVHRAAKAERQSHVFTDVSDRLRAGERERVEVVLPIVTPGPRVAFLYDSDSEDPPFSEWFRYVPGGSTSANFPSHLSTRHNTCAISAVGTEDVCISKSLPVLAGAVAFEYQVIEPDVGWHVYFAMIPMQVGGALEVGARINVDPRNARSPYRLRMFVPGDHYSDGSWHAASMTFNFEGLPTASHSVFAPRINEGVDAPGRATMLVRRVRAWRD